MCEMCPRISLHPPVPSRRAFILAAAASALLSANGAAIAKDGGAALLVVLSALDFGQLVLEECRGPRGLLLAALRVLVDIERGQRVGDVGGGLAVLAEHPLQYLNHELHRGVVVIQEPHFGQ